MSRVEYVILSIMTGLSLVVLIAVGRLAPQITHDTPGYLQIVGFPAMLAGLRTPFYGWLVAILDLGRGSYVFLPAFQILTYFAACWLFVAALRDFGLSQRAVLSVGAALLSANALLMVSNWIHPEFPAITCALLAFTGTVRLAQSRRSWWAWLMVGAGAGSAYILRPSFLPLVIVLPALFLCLQAIRGDSLRLARTFMVFLASAIPFIGISSLRAATVGDFNIVSFGGYIMSGMATLMLDDDVVARLPPDVKPFAAEMLAIRRAGEESGKMIGIPLNSENIRSYPSVTLAYFDVLARTHDDILAFTGSARKQDENWVDYNRRLMRFSLAVIRAAPERYVMWLVGASTRTFSHLFVTNLPAMLAIVVVVFVWPWRLLVKGQVGVVPASRLDFPVMAICGILWFVAAGSLPILIHAPAIRFIETSSLLIAPVLIYWAVLLLSSSRGAPVPGARA